MPDEQPTPPRVLLAVDMPKSGAATAGALVISGWSFSRGGARIVEVEARLGSHSTVIPQGVRRPDVALAMAEPHADWSGFEGTLTLEECMAERVDRLVVRATDELGECAEVQIPVRIWPSGRPAMEIERALWVAGRVELEGWFLWPDSTPSRTLELFLGETRLAESAPNLSRPDVARRFPSFARGSCRGFRFSEFLDLPAVPVDDRVLLRVVCTDSRAQQLEHTTVVACVSSLAPPGPAREAALQIENAVALAGERSAHEPLVLDWQSGFEVNSLCPALAIFRPPAADELTLPYLDQTLDIVVTDGSDAQRVAEARRVAAIATVEGTTLRWQPAAPRQPEPPAISIIVSVHGRATHVEACLARLKETLPADFRGEVVVVDDHSSGDRRAALRRLRDAWPQLRVLRNEAFVGYARSCQRGAEAARGELLVFLDDALLLRPGWMLQLVRLLQEDPSVGAAGGKLLNPDGTLWAAGGALFADGSEQGIGRGDAEPNRPVFNFVRDIDFCPNALMAIRRQTFLEIGGFDPRNGSVHDEGVDLCLRLRELGLRVRFQPATVAAFAAGARSDRRRGAGSERERNVSRERFRVRWQRGLSTQPRSRRVLVCAPTMPQYDRESGSRRVFHLIELLQQAGWAVTFVAIKSVAGDRYVRLLQQRGVETYAGPDSVRAGDEYIDDLDELIADGGFELAMLTFWSIAERLLPSFRSLSPATRVVVDSVDLHYLREERAARISSVPEPAANASLRLQRKLRELNTYSAADAVLTVSMKEADTLTEAISAAAPVFCVPDLEELARAKSEFLDRSGLLFIGNFHHPPNLEGLEYLCTEILPRLDPALLAAHPLFVVGNGTDDHVRAVVGKIPNARVVGWVPSVVPYLERVRVSLVPMLHGAGTKRKLVQALMVGTPSVSTSIGVEGLELEHGRHALIADSAEEFAAGIVRLTSDAMLWNRLASEGRAHIERAHGRSSVQQSLESVVECVTKSTAISEHHDIDNADAPGAARGRSTRRHTELRFE